MARTTQGSAILGRMDRRIAAEAAAAARTGGGGPVTLTRVLCDAAAGATGLRAWTGLPWENGGSGSVVLRFERAEDETQAAADARRQATQSILKNALWAGGASQATVMGGSTPPRKGYPTPSGVRGASRGGGVILLDSAQMQALFSRRAQGALAAAAQDIRALWELPALKADLAFAAPGCRVEEIPVVRTSGPPAALGRQAAGL
ncbi:MAG: hypothetical protein JKP92_07290 [Alphaproteobacteria bacterium]|nr:hypothetical protein [Alphaproteobacteria bacterium]